MINLLITGGSGYVGSKLIYRLFNNRNINIINYDLSLYGESHLPKNKNFKYYRDDIRNLSLFEDVIIKNNINVILHLACISNDPSFALDPKISKEINFDCFEDLVKISKKNNVKKFIYVSTCSVYGFSKDSNVDESYPLVPLTDYNKFKGMCEPILNKYIDSNFCGITIRPATICGFSEKMRFDLSVNILTNFAYFKNFINVFGGEQFRPNIHIDDICRLYEFLIFNDVKKYNGEIFNAGSENLKIIDIANKVKNILEDRYKKKILIKLEKSNDQRSYQISSSKIKKILGFYCEKSVDDAIIDLCTAFEKKIITNSFSDDFQNVITLKKLQENNFFN